MAARLLWRVALQIDGRQWTGADQAHLAGDYIPQLREFIQAGRAQELPPRRQALGVGSVAFKHGTEFEDVKGLAVKACPGLPEKYGSAELQHLQ